MGGTSGAIDGGGGGAAHRDLVRHASALAQRLSVRRSHRSCPTRGRGLCRGMGRGAVNDLAAGDRRGAAGDARRLTSRSSALAVLFEEPLPAIFVPPVLQTGVWLSR